MNNRVISRDTYTYDIPLDEVLWAKVKKHGGITGSQVAKIVAAERDNLIASGLGTHHFDGMVIEVTNK